MRTVARDRNMSPTPKTKHTALPMAAPRPGRELGSPRAEGAARPCTGTTGGAGWGLAGGSVREELPCAAGAGSRDEAGWGLLRAARGASSVDGPLARSASGGGTVRCAPHGQATVWPTANQLRSSAVPHCWHFTMFWATTASSCPKAAPSPFRALCPGASQPTASCQRFLVRPRGREPEAVLVADERDGAGAQVVGHQLAVLVHLYE